MVKLFAVSIGRRLGVGFGSLVLLLITVATVQALAAREMSRQVEAIVDVNNVKSELAHAMLSSIDELAIRARSVVLLTEASDTDTEVKRLKVSLREYDTARNQLGALMARSETVKEEREVIARIDDAATQTIPLVERAVREGQQGANVEATVTLMSKVRPKEADWRENIGKLVALEGELNRQGFANAKTAQKESALVAAAIVLASAALGGLIGWRITRSIKRPIDNVIRIAERIARGDLMSEVTSSAQDEIGRLMTAIASMQEKLRTMVKEIRQAAEGINSASADVTTGNEDLSRRTESAAAQLQETASSMVQLTNAVRNSGAAASQADAMATKASDVATRGGEVVAQVVGTMKEIDASSKKIAEITGVIDGIAFQTNILALNAAVEAARAGEQGRGFAVVAGEVRALAQRCAGAAKEIKALIGNSVGKVVHGSQLVEDAGKSMEEIVVSVRQVMDVIGNVTSATQEQSSEIGQVGTAVTRLDAMTQQNAALVEQSAAAARSLRDQAGRLANSVAAFRLEHFAET
jgi:methyl-accepting chemotaxis protein